MEQPLPTVLASNASAKNLAEVATDPEMDSDDIVYTPIGYEELPFRVETPPPEFGWQRNSAEKKQEEEEAKKQIRRAKYASIASKPSTTGASAVLWGATVIKVQLSTYNRPLYKMVYLDL